MSQPHGLIRKKMRWWVIHQECQSKMCWSSAHIWNEVFLVWTDHRRLWKQPGLWDGPAQRCQDGNWLMKCSCRKQPRPLGTEPLSQQPWLLLVTHHEIARVWKLGDIWSFNFNKAAFGISLPGMELFLGIFSNLLYIGNSIGKPLNWILLKTQLEIPRLAHMSDGLMCIHTKKDPSETMKVWCYAGIRLNSLPQPPAFRHSSAMHQVWTWQVTSLGFSYVIFKKWGK